VVFVYSLTVTSPSLSIIAADQHCIRLYSRARRPANQKWRRRRVCWRHSCLGNGYRATRGRMGDMGKVGGDEHVCLCARRTVSNSDWDFVAESGHDRVTSGRRALSGADDKRRARRTARLSAKNTLRYPCRRRCDIVMLHLIMSVRNHTGTTKVATEQLLATTRTFLSEMSFLASALTVSMQET